jgi:DNA polymerase I-like protein with 3'-5' exonuclease and polymerase domains
MTNKKLAEIYEVPLAYKTQRPTTTKGDLEDIYLKTVDAGVPDRVLELTLEIRSIDTTINNYVPNWRPQADGRVHTTWGFKAPSGQLDSSSPNILNLSKWTETGQRFRRIIEAPKGYSIVEFDKKSFHVATMGYCAQDASYIRFSQLDPHSIFASYICPKDWCKPIDLGLSDSEILERSTWLKKRCKDARGNDPHGVDLRQDIAKRVVLANQLGQGKRGLYRKELRRYVENEDEAGRYQDQLNEIFPKVQAFKEQIREVCHKQKYYIIREWGIIDYFFDVFNWRYSSKHGRWIKGSGTDSEKAIAFPVQGTAFGMLKWEHRRMSDNGYMGKFGFINSIHDSNVFCVEDSLIECCFTNIASIMSAPCGVLVNSVTSKEGLRVAVEASVGKNLQDRDYFGEGTNPEGMREVRIER